MAKRTTAEQRQRAVQWYHDGAVTIQQIAGFYGVTTATVEGWIDPRRAKSRARQFAKKKAIHRNSLKQA